MYPISSNVRKGAAARCTTVPFRVHAASLLVIVVLGASAAAQTNGRATRSNIAIDNFGCINENYFRGAQPKGRDYADLASLGVKTVIDLTADGNLDEPTMVRNAGMTFYRIPMTTESRPSSEAVAQFLTLVNDPAKGPIYVHCQGGRHRTGIMTAVYRMTQDGWTADRAYREMQQYGFGPAFLHSALKEFVYDFYTHLDRAQAVTESGR